MSIRLIAKELYRLQQEVGKTEAELETVPYSEREAKQDQLRRVKAEWQRLKNIMAGEKAPPPFSSKPSTFKKF